MDVSIIIVSWNTKDLLKKCLESIYKNQGDLKFEVFVVDNNSIDGSAEMVKNNFSEVILIINKKNLGFAAANNQAIKKTKGKYILALNPDTEVLENALQNSIKFMEQNTKVGVLGCKILNPDATNQPSVRRFPNKKIIFLLASKLSRILSSSQALNKYFCKNFDYTKSQEVDQVMGAFFMIKKELIDQIGIFDEKFFIWFEEVDFCKRTKDAGWQVWYTSDAKIIHHGGQSFKQALTIKKQKMFFKSAMYYLKKHASKQIVK